MDGMSEFPGLHKPVDGDIRVEAEKLKKADRLAPLEEALFFGSSNDVQWYGKAGNMVEERINTARILEIFSQAYPPSDMQINGDEQRKAQAQLEQLLIPHALGEIRTHQLLGADIRAVKRMREDANAYRSFRGAAMFDLMTSHYLFNNAGMELAIILPDIADRQTGAVKPEWLLTVVDQSTGQDVKDSAKKQQAAGFLPHVKLNDHLNPWFRLDPVPDNPLQAKIVFTRPVGQSAQQMTKA